ncbi:MAG TPA: energy transducer TonB [Methylomusa anaerophila]|nr:energy transducer TonB [Methylomusa anaerophila]HML89150.1 energy transducer TonB [Methylomusa anaerophila]
MIDGSYCKSAGISLAVHGVLLIYILCIGQTTPAVVQPPRAAIEIVPASVLETGALTAAPAAGADEPAPEAAPDESEPAAAPVEQRRPARQVQADRTVPPVLKSPAGEAFLPPLPHTSGNEAAEPAASPGAEAADQNSKSQGAGAVQSGSASVLHKVSPGYPSAARKEGWEGAVIVRVLIDVDGSAKTVTVRQSSGYDIFDDTAVRAVAKWRFSPATQGGNPVASFYDVKVTFRLTDPE